MTEMIDEEGNNPFVGGATTVVQSSAASGLLQKQRSMIVLSMITHTSTRRSQKW
jgi:hypothetical protein